MRERGRWSLVPSSRDDGRGRLFGVDGGGSTRHGGGCGEMWGRAERAHYIVGANPEMLTPSEFGGMVAAFGKKVRTAKGRVLWYLGLIAFESQKSGHCGPSS